MPHLKRLGHSFGRACVEHYAVNRERIDAGKHPLRVQRRRSRASKAPVLGGKGRSRALRRVPQWREATLLATIQLWRGSLEAAVDVLCCKIGGDVMREEVIEREGEGIRGRAKGRGSEGERRNEPGIEKEPGR